MKLKASSTAPLAVPTTLLVVVALVAAGLGAVVSAVYFGSMATASGGPHDITVVDDLARSVTAPQDPSRIVVLAPSVMDLVFRLGLRDRVVGVGCTTSLVGGIQNEYSPNQTTLWGLNASLCVADYPSVDTEQVAELDPGLVLASTLTSRNDADTLNQTYHLPVVFLAPRTLDGIVGDVGLLERLFPSTEARATDLEAALELSLYNATTFDSNLSTNNVSIPSVFLTYGFYGGSYYTYGPGTFGDSLIDIAGGSSLSAGVPLQYYGLNASVVLADQPTVILYGTSWNDPYLVAGQTPSVWASEAPYWSQLNGTKIPVDVTLLTEADPTMVLALPIFLHDLHPTLI